MVSMGMLGPSGALAPSVCAGNAPRAKVHDARNEAAVASSGRAPESGKVAAFFSSPPLQATASATMPATATAPSNAPTLPIHLEVAGLGPEGGPRGEKSAIPTRSLTGSTSGRDSGVIGKMSTTEQQAEIGLCLLIANADGEISDEEIAELKVKIHAHTEGQKDEEVDATIAKERAVMTEKGVDAFLASIVERIPEAKREAALRSAVDVAFADMLTSEEDGFVRKVAKALGVKESVVDEMAGPAI
jgi:uncharacterized tellurite resistance protein B-like protein